MTSIRMPHFLRILFLILLCCDSLYAQTLTVYTEEFPPFNFTENNKIVGVSTEVVETVMQRAGMEYKLESLPWARAFKYAKDQPNTLIYSISRRAKREKLFKWIGILVPTVQSVFVLTERTEIKIEQIDDLKRYQIGTTIEDARETYLLNKGFQLENFQRVGGDTSYLQNFKKLRMRRIDVWPMPDAVAYYIVRKAGYAPQKVLRKVYEFSEISQGGYYIAASKKTSDEIVEKIQDVLKVFQKTPKYRGILEKWGLQK